MIGRRAATVGGGGSVATLPGEDGEDAAADVAACGLLVGAEGAAHMAGPRLGRAGRAGPSPGRRGRASLGLPPDRRFLPENRGLHPPPGRKAPAVWVPLATGLWSGSSSGTCVFRGWFTT